MPFAPGFTAKTMPLPQWLFGVSSPCRQYTQIGLVCDDICQWWWWVEGSMGTYVVYGDRIGREIIGLVRRDEHAGGRPDQGSQYPVCTTKAYNPESKPPLMVWHGSLNDDCVAVWLACLKWKVI